LIHPVIIIIIIIKTGVELRHTSEQDQTLKSEIVVVVVVVSSVKLLKPFRAFFQSPD
jgi:uncharacterized membrane protein YqhA